LNVTGGGFPEAVRVWLDGERVVMLDALLRGRPADLKALTVKLGAPAAKLDGVFSGVPMLQGEWIYPERGLALLVNPKTGIPLRVMAYPRATLAEYRTKYRFMGGRMLR
jgi:hypothetical protein